MARRTERAINGAFDLLEVVASEMHSDSSATGRRALMKGLESSPLTKWLVALSFLVLQSTYWTRTWIVQELVLARDAMICCGPRGLPWEKFATAVSRMDQAYEYDRNDVPSPHQNSNWIAHAPGVLNIWSMYQQRAAGNPMPLAGLLERTSDKLATNPKDSIYGLLGLADDGVAFVPEPDYACSLDDAMASFAIEAMKARGVMHFFYIREHSPDLSQKQSWAPDIGDIRLTISGLSRTKKHLAGMGGPAQVVKFNRTGSLMKLSGVRVDVIGKRRDPSEK
jgi:hypothetical protein